MLVGDLYTKGPDPCGVHAQVRDLGIQAVLGNHDERLIDVVAGRRPQDTAGARCVERLESGAPGWRSWLESLPLVRQVGHWTVVHAALHPTGSVERTDRRTALNLRRWPSDAPTDPRWTDVYVGERRVLYGHDAVRGRFEAWRSGVRHLLGLDGGCVYGGMLHGYVVEEDRILSVAAGRVYKDMRPE